MAWLSQYYCAAVPKAMPVLQQSIKMQFKKREVKESGGGERGLYSSTEGGIQKTRSKREWRGREGTI